MEDIEIDEHMVKDYLFYRLLTNYLRNNKDKQMKDISFKNPYP